MTYTLLLFRYHHHLCQHHVHNYYYYHLPGKAILFFVVIIFIRIIIISADSWNLPGSTKLCTYSSTCHHHLHLHCESICTFVLVLCFCSKGAIVLIHIQYVWAGIKGGIVQKLPRTQKRASKQGVAGHKRHRRPVCVSAYFYCSAFVLQSRNTI